MNPPSKMKKYLLPTFWESDELCILGDEQIEGQVGLPEGAVCFASSGTSGVEKWVVHTRESLLCSARAVNEHLEVKAGDVWGLLLPYHHVGGFGVLSRSYAASVPCAIYPQKWNPKEAATFLSDEGVTITSMVPTQVYDLVHASISAPPRLRAVLVGGGSLSLELGERARELGWPVLQTYGMSEAGSQIATADLSSLEVPYINSNLPVLPIWDVCIDESLTIKGKALCSGILYKKEGEFNYVPHSQYTSSDQVEISEGRLTFLQRVDRMVKVKGELVNIDELERTVEAQTGARVVIIAQSHEREGNSLHGFSEASLSIDDLNAYLPPFTHLQSYQQIEQFPKSALGKIDRRVLKDQL